MKYKKKRFTFKINIQRKATDVLYEKMMFYRNEALKNYCKIKEVLESSSIARGDLLVALDKSMHKYNDLAIECASRLAPYQSPKLESIEVRQKVTHSYVIKAPTPVLNSQEWLRTLPAPNPLNIIPPKHINVKANQDFEDAEILNNHQDINANH